MVIRFNKLVRPDLPEIALRYFAEHAIETRAAGEKMVFMSHKTGDSQAEREAKYITIMHKIMVYMVEWDDNVESDTDQLPDYIMTAIRNCDGFLVNVTAEIAVSMWIGYEIGGAHAMRKPRASIMYRWITGLPSVVRALVRFA